MVYQTVGLMFNWPNLSGYVVKDGKHLVKSVNTLITAPVLANTVQTLLLYFFRLLLRISGALIGLIVTQKGLDIVYRTEYKVHDHNKSLVSVICNCCHVLNCYKCTCSIGTVLY